LTSFARAAQLEPGAVHQQVHGLAVGKRLNTNQPIHAPLLTRSCFRQAQIGLDALWAGVKIISAKAK